MTHCIIQWKDYISYMKTKELKRMLVRMGFCLIRSNKHDVYSNGHIVIIMPQHSTIARPMAKAILKEMAYNEDVQSIHYYAPKAA